MIFKIIGNAAESANFPFAFNIEEHIEEMLINTRKGNIIREVWTSWENFSSSVTKPGAINCKKDGIKISTKITINKVDKVNIDMILPANFPDSFVSVPTTNFE